MTEFTLQALHDEIENDPEAIGYKEVGGEWKEDNIIADLINDPANGANILRKLIQPDEIFQSIDVTEWEILTEGRRQYISLITKGEIVDATFSSIFDGLNTVFNNTDAPNTRAEILSRVQRQGSRAEVLWGEGKIVSIAEVGHAANL